MRTKATRQSSSSCALGVVLFATACSGGSGVPDASSSVEGSGSLGVVQLERWAESTEAPSHLLSFAKVARFRGADGPGVERLLGGHGLELESCGLASELPATLGEGDLSVELLDVGTIDLNLGQTAQRLLPRVFPAVGGAAHGVFYVADIEAPQPRAELDEYVAAAPGSGGVGAFEVALPAPGMVEEATLAGRELRGELPVEVSLSHAAELAWTAADPRDRVELELAAGGEVLTCVARDDGHFVIPADQLAALMPDEEGQLTLRRVRLSPFDMQGIEVAYVRAVSAWTVPLRLR